VIVASDEPTFSVSGGTIAEVWEESIRRLVDGEDFAMIDSEVGGPSIEASLVTLRALEPDRNPRISDVYVDPELIDSYAAVLRRPEGHGANEPKTIASRIYAYEAGAAKPIDQFKSCVDQLRRNPLSRRAIIQLWDPASDLGAKGLDSPASHCFLQLRIRDGALHMIAVSRSVDAWLGALPNMLGFFALQERAAERLKLEVGSYSHAIASYHIYLRDVPAACEALSQ
jgi:thymidylate synthase-like protein